MSKQLQFELWQECGSNCTYCYLGKENKHTADELKLQSLQSALDKISDLSLYEEYDTISYLGGEFFQGQMRNPKVKELFMKLMDKTNWLYENGYIKHIWIYATMTIGNQSDLYEMLEHYTDKSGLWILTSYDTIGRFHTPKMLETWETNMKKIHTLFPMIKFNVTTIITGDLIEKYLSGEFSFKKMMQEYHCSFFLKQCGLGKFTSKEVMNKYVGNFFPTRENFIKFLTKYRLEEDEIMWDKLFNIKYRADTLYRNFNENGRQMVKNERHKDTVNEVSTDDPNESILNKCGHLMAYAGYLDDGCAICDKQMIEELA